MSEKITILQLSDLHAGQRFEQRVGQPARTLNERYAKLVELWMQP